MTETKETTKDKINELKERRNALFTQANEEMKKIINDNQHYLNYLSLQARLGYTVTNTLLVLAQNPNAIELKDFKHWTKDKVYLKKGEKGIQILKPGNEYTRKDGSVGTNFNPHYVFDITQTNAEMDLSKNNYSMESLLKALTYKEIVLPEVVSNDSILPTDVYFDKSQNKIYVRIGLTQQDMLHGLIRAYCEANFLQHHDTVEPFIVDSTTYMIAVKYNQANTTLSFNSKDYFLNMDEKQIKNTLHQIKSTFDSVNSKMEQGLYQQNQNRNSKDKNAPER